LGWIVKNYSDFTKEELESMDTERRIENVQLGFAPDGTEPIDDDDEDDDDMVDENEDDDADSIMDFDDSEYQ